ncbi:MAG: hypothetical protein GEU88_02885 [Solirubrobacterales bacterium]|nr:hypothetical protein [Solirubrobacterales bacterium]
MSVAGPSRRYFFVHMQKTAGIELRRRLIRHFGRAAVYPTHRIDGGHRIEAIISIDYLRERMAASGDRIEVIIGHFPLCTTELLEGQFATLTVLRNPVERTLSYLRHHRKNNRRNRDKSLEAIYAQPLHFHNFLQNHMTKMLSLTPGELTAGMLTRVELNDEHLDRAKEALARMEAVGLQERFEEFCDELGARLGWRLGEPGRMNTTAPVEVPDGFRARIAEDNALDIELYEFAEGLVSRRPTAPACRPPSC